MVQKAIKRNGAQTIGLVVTAAGAKAVNNQINIASLDEGISNLENLVSTTSVDTLQEEIGMSPQFANSVYDTASTALLFGLGIAAFYLQIQGTKKSLRKKQAAQLKKSVVSEKTAESKVKGPLWKRAGMGALKTGVYVGRNVALPLAGVSLLVNAIPELNQLYQATMDTANNLGTHYLGEYNPIQMINNLPQPAESAVKVGIGLSAILGLQGLYTLAKKNKHGPILARIDINKYNWFGKNLYWHNWVRSEKLRLFGGRGFLGKMFTISSTATQTSINRNYQRSTTITSHTLDGKEIGERVFISYSMQKEPQKGSNAEIYPSHIRTIIETFKEYINNHPLDESIFQDENGKPKLPQSEVMEIARDSELHSLIAEDKSNKLKIKDVDRILHALVSDARQVESGNVLDINAEECALYANDKNFNAGEFLRVLEVEDGSQKRPVSIGTIQANIPLTTKLSILEYGDDFIEQKKILPVFNYLLKKGGDMDDCGIETLSLEDFSEEAHADFGMANNFIKQVERKGFDKLLNWGHKYHLQYTDKVYDIEMDFFGSFPVWWTNPKDPFIRKKFYIKDSNKKTVGKLVEYNILAKSIGDNDFLHDIYVPEHIDDKGVRSVLMLFSQYLGQKSFYDKSMMMAIQQQKEHLLEVPHVN